MLLTAQLIKVCITWSFSSTQKGDGLKVKINLCQFEWNLVQFKFDKHLGKFASKYLWG